jgi:carboxyl-terminal processing protease
MSEGDLMRFFWRCMKLVRYNYVDDIDYASLVEKALQGLLSNIDPHSMYFDRKEFVRLEEQCKGSFGGVGIVMTNDRLGMRVISCLDDTPAALAGILPGDIIVGVNDKVITSKDTFSSISEMLRGFPGTSVKLSIDRKGETKVLHFNIKRSVISVKSVKHHISGNVGVIRIANFDEQTARLLKKAILDIQAQKKDQLHGYIVDLRKNPGGLVDQAVACCQMFIDKGVLLRSKGRSGVQEEIEYAVPGLSLVKSNTPVVVLIDEGSASASEMMAGALKDHNVAIILGKPSFGKGSTQRVFPMEDSIGGGMKITIMRWYTPNGHPIQGHGITPHIVVNQVKSIEPISGDEFTVRESSYMRSLPCEPKKEGNNGDENGKGSEKGAEKPAKECVEKMGPLDGKPSGNGAVNMKKSDQKDEQSDAKELDYQMMRAEDLINGMHFFIQQQQASAKNSAKNDTKKDTKNGPDAGDKTLKPNTK